MEVWTLMTDDLYLCSALKADKMYMEKKFKVLTQRKLFAQIIKPIKETETK